MKCEDILLKIYLTYFLASSIITMESPFHDTIMDDCLREADWNRGKPYTYRTEDYDFLMRSPKLFAREPLNQSVAARSGSFVPTDRFENRYATNYENYTYSLISGSYAAGLNDYSIIDSYARAAVNWALNCGIIDEGTTWFHPSMGTSRQWCAQYLFDFLSKVLGTGKSFAIRSLSVGRSSNISYIISSMGYQSCLGYDLTPREMKFALQNSKILFSHSHGGDDSIVLNGGSLTAADIRKNSLSNLELAYISACYAGNNFITALRDTGGAGAVVGFKSTISAGSDSNGIHYFNERFFYYLKNGNSIYNSIRKARADTYEVYKAYYGSDQAVYYGSYYAN